MIIFNYAESLTHRLTTMNFDLIFSSVLLLVFAFQCQCFFYSKARGVCYGILGCFNITHDFHHYLFRPWLANVLPTDPQYYNISILLYRNSGKHEEVIPKKWFFTKINGQRLKNFDGQKETKFLITGYRDTPNFSSWQKELKDNMLAIDNYNIFIVDWSNGTRESTGNFIWEFLI